MHRPIFRFLLGMNKYLGEGGVQLLALAGAYRPRKKERSRKNLLQKMNFLSFSGENKVDDVKFFLKHCLY